MPITEPAPRRTEDEILSQAPIKVMLGNKEHHIKVLRIAQARAWREKLVNEVNEITKQLRVETGSDESFMGALGFTFLRFPEKMVDLVFSYAPDLPRERSKRKQLRNSSRERSRR
jgi:hypothetical protein